MAVFLLLLGWVLVRWIRSGFEAAGLSPERAERGMWGMLGAAARTGPSCRSPGDLLGLYVLVGIFLLAKGLKTLRGNRCD